MKNTGIATTYTLLKPEKKTPPTIIFTQKAIKWIEALIDAHSTEVGFYGVVEENKETYTYTVTDIFYPKHQVMNAATCEISKEGEETLMLWLIQKNRDADLHHMFLWGHSHHTMGVTPSGQDDTQALERMNSTQNVLIRIIVNKEKLMSVSFFDFEKQIKFDNVVWTEDKSSTKAQCITVLNEINAVITGTLDEQQKIIEIDRIMYSDPETDAIKAKIEELKRENVPAVQSYAAGNFSGRDYSYGHGSYYDREGSRIVTTHDHNKNKSKKNGKGGNAVVLFHGASVIPPIGTKNSYENESQTTEEEVEDMVANWRGI